MAVIGVVEFDEKQIKQLSTFEQTLIKIVNPLLLKASAATGTSTFATAQTGNISVGPGGALDKTLRLLLSLSASDALNQLRKDIASIFEVDPTPATLEDRIKALQEKAGELRVSIAGAQSALDLFGEDPNSIINGIPVTQEAINEQIDIAKLLQQEIIVLKKQLEREQSGIVLEIPVDFQLPANANLSPLFRDLKLLDSEGNPIEREQIQNEKLLREEINNGNEVLEQRSQILPVLEGATAMLNDTMSDAVNPLQAHKDALEASNNVSQDLNGNAEDLADNFKDTNKQVAQAEKTVGKFDGTAVDLGTSLEKTDEVAQQLGENGLPKIEEGAKVAGDGIVEATETGKRGLSSLGVFAGNIATNIAESFSGFISTAIKGDFDGIEDLWDNLLDSLQDSFADLVGGFLTNPIRVAFETTLKGEGGITDFFKDLFGGGKKKTEKNQQNVIFLDEFRENKQEFRLAA